MSVTVEQARRLSEAAGVDVIAALSALERNNGDALEAMLELERMGLTPPPPGGGFYSTRPSGGPAPSGLRAAEAPGGGRQDGAGDSAGTGLFRDLFHHCLATRLEVRRKGQQAASVPLLILVALVLFFPWTIVMVLGVGLLLGFRYRLSGPLVEGEGAQRFLSALRGAFDRFLALLRRS